MTAGPALQSKAMPPEESGRQPDSLSARTIRIEGRVQGVGFRPFVYRTALKHGIAGRVCNQGGEVLIHAEGTGAALARFEHALRADLPPLAQISSLRAENTVPEPCLAFTIAESAAADRMAIHVPPDLFTCESCLSELRDSTDRRYRYPFINCTDCGPRYTIIRGLPYDRPATSMAEFPLCEPCRKEYQDPLDRRFHAEPVACPACGPALTYSCGGKRFTDTQAALRACLDDLAGGRIVAVKGIGGYHLMCDAASDEAVARLRQRKGRPHKPLAVMFPLQGADGLDAVRAAAHLEPEAEVRLLDAARPIVLVPARAGNGLAPSLAPGLDDLGVFLPYSPLHHILLGDYGRPLVATSGNVSGEPVITGAEEAEARLGAVADSFIHHDRPIVRPADDSVYRMIAGRARPIRLGRGSAPVEIRLPAALPEPVLATGGHLKAALALAWEDRLVISPHIGDLDSPRARDVFGTVAQDLQALYDVDARCVLHDAHPDYAGTRWARAQGQPLHAVLHHHAHASALAGENPRIGRWLIFSWDGVGYGEDGTLWGGETFLGAAGNWRRTGTFRPFRLPGGERAGREPRRSAAGLMWKMGQAYGADTSAFALMRQAWERRLNAPVTSAVGRLFDGAAALVLGREVCTFEGQGPMELEANALRDAAPAPVPLTAGRDGLILKDWALLIEHMAREETDAAVRAGVFHASLAAAIANEARMMREQIGERFDAVGLTGGVFQNRLLSELAVQNLEADGFRAVLAESLPMNDGGLAFGQVADYLGRTVGWQSRERQ